MLTVCVSSLMRRIPCPVHSPLQAGQWRSLPDIFMHQRVECVRPQRGRLPGVCSWGSPVLLWGAASRPGQSWNIQMSRCRCSPGSSSSSLSPGVTGTLGVAVTRRSLQSTDYKCGQHSSLAQPAVGCLVTCVLAQLDCGSPMVRAWLAVPRPPCLLRARPREGHKNICLGHGCQRTHVPHGHISEERAGGK